MQMQKRERIPINKITEIDTENKVVQCHKIYLITNKKSKDVRIINKSQIIYDLTRKNNNIYYIQFKIISKCFIELKIHLNIKYVNSKFIHPYGGPTPSVLIYDYGQRVLEPLVSPFL